MIARLAPLGLLALAACSAGGVPKPEVPFERLKGDVARGAVAFNACRSCHAAQAGEGGVGPHLQGVVGRQAGSLSGYAYSTAMRAHGQAWTPAHLYAFLAAPYKVVPGTKMSYGGLPDPQQRADVVAYLATLR